jgi:UDPglucose 6-dehydrogenase
MKIGIIGLGVVGSAIRLGFERLGHAVATHDIRHGTTVADVLDTEVVYVCVPTPARDDGSCHVAVVESVVRELEDAGYRGVVAVKSTVAPGTTERLLASYPSLTFAFVPEFLRERCALVDFTENHDVCVIGTHDATAFDRIRSSHGKYPRVFVKLSPTEAEFCKYFNNVYNATLITFANSFYDLCVAAGADYEKVKDAIVKRDHIHDRYLDCNENFRGFGGMCLPKDLAALIAFGRERKANVDFFESIRRQNAAYKTTLLDGMRPDKGVEA